MMIEYLIRGWRPHGRVAVQNETKSHLQHPQIFSLHVHAVHINASTDITYCSFISSLSICLNTNCSHVYVCIIYASLEVVSSIPAGSTIIHRFLCGFIYVSLYQSIQIKPTNMTIHTYAHIVNEFCQSYALYRWSWGKGYPKYRRGHWCSSIAFYLLNGKFSHHFTRAAASHSGCPITTSSIYWNTPNTNLSQGSLRTVYFC